MLNKKRFELSLPNLEHAQIIWEWRQDPDVLKNSLTYSKPISLEDFYPRYLENYFTLPDLPPLFILDGGKRIGSLRFNQAPGKKNCEISIILAKEARGKGIAADVIREAVLWIEFQGYSGVLAKIKTANIASQKAFEKADFHFEEEKEGIKYYKRPIAAHEKDAVFIIAEAGSNWKTGTEEEDLACAYEMIEKAKASGADAIKFQVFRADKTYVERAGSADYLKNSKDISDLFQYLEMPYSMIEKLFEHCQKHGIEFMATPFSIEDFEAIDPFVKRHKIASYENNHIRLLEKAAQSKKPVLLSTGASSLDEISWAYNFLKMNGSGEITLLQCTAKYPAPAEDMNLNVILSLKGKFRSPVGLSDHSLDPLAAPLAAAALGASVIEKHFTLDRSRKGPDHPFSITPPELKELVSGVRKVEKMRGSYYKRVEPSENELYDFAKRGIQAIREINEGDLFLEGENIAILRPGKQSRGRNPREIDSLAGKRAEKKYRVGDGIS